MLERIFRALGLHWRNRSTGGFLAHRHEKKLLLPRGVGGCLKLTFSGGLAVRRYAASQFESRKITAASLKSLTSPRVTWSQPEITRPISWPAEILRGELGSSALQS